MTRARVVYPDVRHERTAERFAGLGVTSSPDLLEEAGLTERERATVCAYLGFDGLAPTSMPALAGVLGITKQAVWYLLQNAYCKLARVRYPIRAE